MSKKSFGLIKHRDSSVIKKAELLSGGRVSGHVSIRDNDGAESFVVSNMQTINFNDEE